MTLQATAVYSLFKLTVVALLSFADELREDKLEKGTMKYTDVKRSDHRDYVLEANGEADDLLAVSTVHQHRSRQPVHGIQLTATCKMY